MGGGLASATTRMALDPFVLGPRRPPDTSRTFQTLRHMGLCGVVCSRPAGDVANGGGDPARCRADLDEIAEFWKSSYPARVRVVVAPSPVLARPGPRMAGSIEYLARIIHGE